MLDYLKNEQAREHEYKLRKERDKRVMEAIQNDTALRALLATTRDRGGHPRMVANLLTEAKENPEVNIWELTSNYAGKKLNSIKVGLTNALKVSAEKDNFRIILSKVNAEGELTTEDHLYFVRVA